MKLDRGRGTMMKLLVVATFVTSCGPAAEAAGEGVSVWTDPGDPGIPADLSVQGEYVGGVEGGDSLGCQVIALGDGHFQAVFFPGGLPGAGWDTRTKIPVDGRTVEGKTIFEPSKAAKTYLAGSPEQFSAVQNNPEEGQRDYRATIAGDTMSGTTDGGKAFTLRRTVRKSPTLGAKPPPGAVVLFDGSGKDEWLGGRVDEKLALLCTDGNDIRTKKKFSNYRMHIEFMLPFRPHARGQGRGNSGFYQVDHYEVQVLDSFGLEGLHNECGGVYKKARPVVNMCLPPLTWQTYDIEFRNATTDEMGGKTGNAVVTLEHNGTLVHSRIEVDGPTGGHRGDPEGTPGPIKLQGHGNPLQYRNIWIVEEQVREQVFECSAAISNLIEVVRYLPTGDPRRREVVLEEVLGEPGGLGHLLEMIVPSALPDLYNAKARYALHGLAMHVSEVGEETVQQAFARSLAEELEKDRPTAVRKFLLRELQLVGGPEQVVLLAELALDPLLGPAATQALIATGGEKARAAARNALDRADDTAKSRLILAAGLLRDPASITRLARYVSGPLRIPAMSALGKMADRRAVDPLLRAAANATNRYEQIIAAAACLELADGLSRSGGGRYAAKLCRALGRRESASYPGYIHMAAMIGLARLGDPDAIGDFLEALHAGDRRVRTVALDLLCDIPGEKVTRGVLSKMPSATSVARAGIVRMLGDRGDPLAVPAILDCFSNTNLQLRVAAIDAAGRFGTRESINALVQQLAAGPPCCDAAQHALRKTPGETTDRMISAHIEPASNAVRVALMGVLAGRNATNEAAVVRRFAGSQDVGVRNAAVSALGSLGGIDDVGFLARLLTQQTNMAERTSLARSLGNICARVSDPPVCTRIVGDCYMNADAGARRQFLAILKGIGGASALKIARRATKDPDPGIADEAVRTLAGWRDDSPISDLLAITRTSTNARHGIVALRGFIDMVGGAETDAEKLDKYQQAMAAAERAEEKRLVCAGLAKIPSLRSMACLDRCLGQEEIAAEVAVALLDVAEGLHRIHRQEAIRAVTRAREATDSPAVQKKADEITRAIERYEDYVLDWLVCGPYRQVGKTGDQLLGMAFSPENPGDDTAWQEVRTTDGVLDLVKAVGGDNSAAYMRAAVYSPEDQVCQLQLGSDDGVKVWLNGDLIHHHNAIRALRLEEDKLGVRLKKGRNTLAMKVTNNYIDWEACARFRKPDGGRLTNLLFKADVEAGEIAMRLPAVVPRAVAAAVPTDAESADADVAAGAPTAGKLGWRLGVQAWSFRRFTFFEAVDKVASLGLHCIEAYPGQRLSAEKPDLRMDPRMDARTREDVSTKLREKDVKLVCFGVVGLGNDEAACREVFEWANQMGVETIVSEPPPEAIGMLDRLCREYRINLALHNHPRPSRYWNPETVLEVCEGRSKRIGACADTGHWMRSGLDPVEALKKLEGRIVSFHFKDLNELGGGAHDVPWGTGKGNARGMLAEIQRQGLRAVFSVEYEHNWDKSFPEIAKCVEFFEQTAAELAGAGDGSR